MIGVVAGGVAAAAVYATTRLLFGSAAAIVAGLLLRSGVPVASGLAGVVLAGVLTVLDARRRLPLPRPGR
jgi:hypothetical protein